MKNAIAPWNEPTGSIVPKSASTAVDIAQVAVHLSTRDQRQIVSAFTSDSFEMMAGFVLNKALAQLKRTLAGLGMAFVGEMLGRSDLNEDSIPTVSISDFEAITLARELGVINSTDAKRLTQHLELLAHFDGLSHSGGLDTEEMTREEALSFLRTCVNSILGRPGNIAPLEFLTFRAALESRTFKETDEEVDMLKSAPHFFKKTTLGILLAGCKTKSGAAFEHTLGNLVVLVPTLWPNLREAEKWSVGQAYAEVVSAGATPAVVALKKALSAVQGFDFVPESLRSQTFSAAAGNLITVHTAMNNFYNEPSAVGALAKLGSTIPWPAFPVSMSAILAVVLGNSYGRSHAAQIDANELLARLTSNQWDYYLNECLQGDELVLQKIAWYPAPQANWCELAKTYNLIGKSPKNKDVARVLRAAEKNDLSEVSSAATKLLAAVTL